MDTQSDRILVADEESLRNLKSQFRLPHVKSVLQDGIDDAMTYGTVELDIPSDVYDVIYDEVQTLHTNGFSINWK